MRDTCWFGVQGREISHPSAMHQSRRVTDVDSANMQRDQDMKTASGQEAHKVAHDHIEFDRPPKRLKFLVCLQHCFQVLHVALDYVQFAAPSACFITKPMTDREIIDNLLKSETTFYFRKSVARSRMVPHCRRGRRRPIIWKPVLPSIPETGPLVDFTPPPGRTAMPRSISPPRHAYRPTADPSEYVPPPKERVPQNPPPQTLQRRKKQRPLYMA
ncbi:hypothetical protein KC19_4G024700 [Ceratodon purpureus]|uniref:Uncharacterized protein n=1 Tax=Ceratodon purpureus TaxID=3225 RepID=A0A8T0I4G2_CERPU|nr:hypothetical protein KC19_4G024700 [Ceratodon purpureus]